ncbi:MAG: nickel-dependent hydrogenase large subunit, partial [Armatimonadota bacterium]
RYLSYGVFDMEADGTDLFQRGRFLPAGALNGELTDVEPSQITEDLRHSYFDDDHTGRHPSQGETEPDADKSEAYSWAKAPRLGGEPHEVGPLARWLVAYHAGDEKVTEALDGLLSALDAPPKALESTLGRHAARALETQLVARAMRDWALELEPGEPVCADYELPDTATGTGFVGGPRGALMHHVDIDDGVISRYQLVVPTTWNVSPRDDNDVPGPIEQALLGTEVADEQNPFEVVRIARSFDPCLACAVHLVDARNNDLGEYRIL